MVVKLNSKGNTHARSLVNDGKVNKTTSWSFSADDGNKLLGKDDWDNYSSWHLGIDPEAEKKTKAYYKYPFGKGGQVYRSGLIAIRQRAGQQKTTDIYEAAGRLLKTIDKEKDDTMLTERRFMSTEIRIVKNGDDAPKIMGYAAKFNKLSEDLGGFREKIAPGAFIQSVMNDDIRALWNHDPNYVLGRTDSGTLVLEENSRGLKMEVEPPDVQWARDLMVSIERGDVTGQSFGFSCVSDTWEIKNKDEEENIRTLNEAKLYDVGPVTFPAYHDTNVAVRALMESTGLNFEELSRVMIRHKHGLEISENDRSIIERSLDMLKQLIPSSPKANEEEGNNVSMHRVGLLRKKLELKERGLNL